MKKLFSKLFIVLITLTMILSVISAMPMKVSAATTPTIAATASGTCGTGVYWEYFEDTQTLYIHGSGAITSSPWSSYASSINKIIVGNEITSICKGAFRECQAVTEITLPFIGESKKYGGPDSVFGYIFGYDTVYFKQTTVSSYDTYSGEVYSTCSTSSFSSTIKYQTYDDSRNQYVNSHLGNGSGLTLGEFANDYVSIYSGELNNSFVNYQVNISYEINSNRNVVIPRKSSWQYSAYTYPDYIHYYNPKAGVGYSKIYGYSLESYFYYIPSTLSEVNITNTYIISTAAFNGCTNIDTINFYSDVNVMGVDVFQNCDADINYLYDSDSNKYTYTNGLDTFTYTVQNGNATIVGCSSENEAITVPSSIEEYPVTAIGYKAFADKSQIKSVLLPTTITHIDSYAFYNCTNLENITLGTSLDEIGDYAFYNTALTKVTTPTSLRRIGNYAFANCSALAKFTMRSGVESLGDAVFYNDTQLSDVTLSNTIDAISDFCFYNCSALTEINIPASVIKIGNCAFEKCSNLSMVTVEGNVEYIGKKAFYACKLSSFDFGNKLTYLGADSFSLTPITTVDLPNTVTQIGAQAFSDCQLLSNLYVPDSVTIGSNALYNNASNLKVTIRYNTGSIPNKMLYKNKMSIVVMEDGITDIGEYAFAECTELTEITFPKTLKNIDNYAFYKSKLSANITLPQKVTTIGSYAFSGTTALSEVSVPDSIQTIGARAFDSNVSVSIYYRLGEICNDLFKGQLVKGIFIGDEIYSIGNNAFANCTNLVELSLPDTISTVGSGCFISSNNIVLTIRTVDGKIDNEVFRGKLSVISTVNLDNSNIGDYAFADNVNLKNVSISAISEIATMTSIGDHSFEGCTSLSKLVLPVTVYNIGSHAFYGCTSLTSINIPSGVTQIKPYTFYNCSSLSSMTLPQTVSSIGEYAFYDCADMISINIPDGVEAISDYTFYGCESLEEIDIADSVTNIGNYAFYGCVAMSLANISDQCVSIGDYAFYNCKTLASLELPNSLKNIGDYAFASCIKLTNVTLGDAVESLGESAFYNCTGLLSISFGKCITALPSQAIGGCYNLESVYIYAPLSHIDDYAFYGAESTTAYIGYDVYMINFFEENGIDYVIMDGYVYEYKITFVTDTGEVICSDFYASGSTVTPPANPTKASDNTYMYVFAGWDQEITTVGGHKTYTAIFTPVYIDYTVIFKDYNGNTISTKTYHYGDTIIAPSNPTRAADNTYTYTFAGWDNEIVACAGDATYTASYTPTYIEYTVVFKDYDGEIISTDTYHYGDAVTAPSNPVREADLVGTYSFKSWDNEVENCIGNATYTAIYDMSYIDYTVVFKDYDGDVISTKTYHYGDTIIVPTNPTREADNTYTYAFAGWDKSVVSCAGNATYTATYTPTYIKYTIIFKDYDGETISSKDYHYGDTVTVPSDPTRAADNTYTYAFAGWDANVASTCGGSATYTATYTPTHIEYTIVFKDYDGEIISTNTYHYGDKVTAPTAPTRETDVVGSYTFKAWGAEVVACASNATYTATYDVSYTDYTVVFKNYNGDVLSTNTYHYGDTVVVPSAPSKPADETYTYAFIGWDKTVTTCEGDATYTAKFAPTNVEYTVVFKNADGTVLSTKTYYYGAEVVIPNTPTKASDNTYTYTFAGWDQAVVNCAGNATYTATYNSTYIDYIVVFKNEDGFVISSKAYHYGDTVIVPETPAKAADNTYTYTFAGWDSTVVACNGDKIYTATYTPVYIEYTVVFKNYDGSIISSAEYHYDQTVTKPSDPTREADNTYTYTFAGWDKTVTSCTESTVYTATYSSTYIEYEVVFKNYDGTILSTDKYHYGDTVVVPETPTKPADASYTYGFAGWDSEVTVCSGNKTYTATFNPTNMEYTVVFKDYNGNIISSEIYHFGEEVTVPSEPTRAADNTYTYTFKDWGKTVTKCVGNAEYTAVYTAEYIEYTVTFLDWDGSLIQTVKYHYGDTIVAIADPERASDETYTYTFLSWNKALGTCTGNASFTAQYESNFINYTVVFKDHDGSVISRKTYHFGDSIVIPANPVRVADETYTYTFKNWGDISTFCNGNKEYTATYDATYIDYTVVFKDHDGVVISTQTYHYGAEVATPSNPMRVADIIYTYAFAGWDKEVVDCVADATYTATYTHTFIDYTVVFKNHDGSVLSTQTYHYGDAVSAPEAPTRESDAIGSYTFKAWDKTVVNCAGDATYTATYEINYTDYTVVFKDDDGTVLSTNTYHYGDEVTVPTAPTKAADDEYTYTFAGWDKEIVACAGDATYTATYSSTKIEDIQTSTPDTDSNTDANAPVDSSMTENNTDTDKKSGCAGAIGGASVGVITLISVGGALLLKKKKRK